MTKRYLATSWLLFSAAALSGCGSIPCGNGHPYAGSTSRPPLKAPAGLTVPAPDPAYVIPGEGKPGDADKADACMIVPPNVLPAPSSSAAPAAATAAPAAPAAKIQPVPAPVTASKAPPVAAGGPLG